MNPLSDTAGRVDSAFLFITGISVVLLVLVTALMLFFVFRYSRKRHPEPIEVEGNLTLEIIWTVIPTIIVLAMFYVGFTGFQFMRNPPGNAMTVKAVARMWSWAFEYENGAKSDVLKVPLGRPVKLAITSEDVLHGLFIPAFRVKEDAVPGMTTKLWFTPNEPGSYDLFCTEYCGQGHSAMITKVEVMKQDEFDNWYSSDKSGGAEPKGLQVLTDKGCLGCHSTDGSKKIGPTFKGIWGRKEVVVTNGAEREITVDEEYLKRSMLEPNADVVKGYPAIMPSQKGVLNEQEIVMLVDYLKTLK